MSFHPQTPQSPSQLSPGTSDLASSMNSSITSLTTLPTPAHSVNGSTSHLPDTSHDYAMGDDTPQKRKRSIGDVGERDQKKPHVEDGKLDIDDLHQDVGEKYLLCQTPHRTQEFPCITEDLFEMFGLTDIAAEVAREKSNGDKTIKNGLRKTYKGHIKRLGIMGRFDSVAQEWEEPEEVDDDGDQDEDDRPTQKKEKSNEPYFGFGKMMNLSDPEFWHGRSYLMQGLTPRARAELPKALAMAKGQIPEGFDASVLNDDGSRPAAAARSAAPGTPIGTPGSNMGQLKQAQGIPRPQRVNKKRGYGDNSFEGYEGYEDGYATGDGDDRGGQKRRKKAVGTPQFQNGTPRPSYGSGIGV
ncbi:hypothetical protein BN1723_003610 [Verticillium longisporum]|uniref:Mediator of RNA polymerase II transcription subunit 19 n=1 Tax=Verticillium longisporum TaxID=100787 RepID=A0A0G4M638_VERLO|nr:hypothetical protein BN1723_003610 [Verticillium longisporum]